MRYSFTLILLLLALASVSEAQTVLWASKVVRFSTEYRSGQYSANQVLGVPDVFPCVRESPCAWSPLKASNRDPEFVEVSFEKEIFARQVVVVESFNAGYVSAIRLTDTQGNVLELAGPWKSPVSEDGGRLLSVPIAPQKNAIAKVEVRLDTRHADHWPHIDAIGISDSEAPIMPKINLAEGLVFTTPGENLGPNVNFKTDEIMPVISPDGRRLYFDRKDHPENMNPGVNNDDIWYADLDAQGKFLPAVNAGEPLNNNGHNYLISLSTNGKKAVLGNCYEEGGYMKSGLSQSDFKNGNWTLPECVTIRDYVNNNKFTEFSVAPSGKILVLAIDPGLGEGGKELLVSFWENGAFSKPKHMGAVINSAATEMSPFLAADEKTLFFASDGFAGYGNKDLFVTRRLDDTWTNWTVPQNLGPVINTPKWDGYFSVPASGNFGYYCSEKDAIGKTDIFRILLPQPLRPIASVVVGFKVQNKETGEPLAATVTAKPTSGAGEEKMVEINDAGEGSLILTAGMHWEISVQAPGYAPVLQTIDLTGPHNADVLDLVLQLSRL